MSKEHGVLTFKRKDKTGHFAYSYRISDHDAAKILQYIATIPHKVEPFRDGHGRFSNPFKAQPGGKEE